MRTFFVLPLNSVEVAEEVGQAWGVAIWQQRRAGASQELGEASFLGAEGWMHVGMGSWALWEDHLRSSLWELMRWR